MVTYAKFVYYVYNEDLDKCVPQTFYAPLPEAPRVDKKVFGPVPNRDADLVCKRKAAPAGTRYCEELDAYVPAHCDYSIRGIRRVPALLKDRIRTREFWRVEGADAVSVNRTVCAIGLTHSKMTLVPLRQAQKDAGIKYRCL